LGDWIARQDQDKGNGQGALPGHVSPDGGIARARPDAGAPAALPPRAAPPERPAGGVERLVIVAVDPGHGGEDPGASGPGGTHEKDVVLRIALKLRDRINDSRVDGNPMRAFLTRDADYFVPLATRVAKARHVGADLFMSIHADASPSSSDVRGADVFALSDHGASSAAARWLAHSENQSDRIGGVNLTGTHDALLQSTLLDMSTTMQIRDSLKFGSALLSQIGRVEHLRVGYVERAGFAVLKAPDIPSVLVETAFITNPEEEMRLRSDAFQSAMAGALTEGIQKYFAANPPLARSRAA
jgi:N-acetylmuramoyl-L-alanine amidase